MMTPPAQRENWLTRWRTSWSNWLGERLIAWLNFTKPGNGGWLSRFLLWIGANPKITDTQGHDLIYLAANHNDFTLVTILNNDYGISIRPPQEEPVEPRDSTQAILTTLTTQRHANRPSSLFAAITHKNLSMFRFLLDNGADVNSVDHTGNTILHLLINPKQSSWILQHLGDPIIQELVLVKNQDGKTPLQLAAALRPENFKLLEELLRCIVNSTITPSTRSILLREALLAALQAPAKPSERLIRALVRHGALQEMPPNEEWQQLLEIAIKQPSLIAVHSLLAINPHGSNYSSQIEATQAKLAEITATINHHAQELSEKYNSLQEAYFRIRRISDQSEYNQKFNAIKRDIIDQIKPIRNRLLFLELDRQDCLKIQNLLRKTDHADLQIAVLPTAQNQANLAHQLQQQLNEAQANLPATASIVELLQLALATISSAESLLTSPTKALSQLVAKLPLDGTQLSDEQLGQLFGNLLRAGADPSHPARDMKNNLGGTLMRWAVTNSKFRLAETLIDHGIDLDDQKNLQAYDLPKSTISVGKSAMSQAIHKNIEEQVEWCLNHGASPNTTDDTDGRPLLHASKIGNPTLRRKLVQSLLDHGAEVNAPAIGIRPDSPLHEAVRQDDLDLLGLLLEHGADPNSLNFSFDYPTDDTPSKNYCLKITASRTPLHLAVAKGDLAMVQALLQRGADPGLKNEKGQDALAIAQQLAENNRDNPELAQQFTDILTLLTKSQEQQEQPASFSPN